MVNAVLFLDDDEDLRAIVVMLLEGMGISCEAVATLPAMQAAVARAGRAFDVAIVDINLGEGQPSGVEAYRWLREHGFAGRIAFLTGHARSHPLVAEALRVGDASVYDKPIATETLHELLR